MMKDNPDSLAKVEAIKGVLANMMLSYFADVNDEETRQHVTEDYVDFLGKQSFNDFMVICDGSNNTLTRIDANQLWVDLSIQVNEDELFIHVPLCLSPAPNHG